MAPFAARTDVVPTQSEADDTRNLEAPEAGQLVEHMLESNTVLGGVAP